MSEQKSSQNRSTGKPSIIIIIIIIIIFHHLQPADPTSNPACGHMTSPPLTLQEVSGTLSMFSSNEG